MITKQSIITGEVSVWAIPKSSWEMEKGADPFKFVLATGDMSYCRGAVKVYTTKVDVMIPAGIDLLQQAIATLEEQQKNILAEAHKKHIELQEEINRLRLLTHAPSTQEGEYLPAGEEFDPNASF